MQIVLQNRLHKSFQGLVGVDEPNSADYQMDYDVDKRVSGYGNLMTALRTLNVDDITCLYPCYDDTLMDGYKKYVNEYDDKRCREISRRRKS